MGSALIPIWLKVAYLLFLAVWIPACWLARGPATARRPRRRRSGR